MTLLRLLLLFFFLFSFCSVPSAVGHDEWLPTATAKDVLSSVVCRLFQAPAFAAAAAAGVGSLGADCPVVSSPAPLARLPAVALGLVLQALPTRGLGRLACADRRCLAAVWDENLWAALWVQVKQRTRRACSSVQG